MVFKTSRLPPLNRSPKTFAKSVAIWKPTSIPTSSDNVAAPTGNPKLLVILSNCLGLTPS